MAQSDLVHVVAILSKSIERLIVLKISQSVVVPKCEFQCWAVSRAGEIGSVNHAHTQTI